MVRSIIRKFTLFKYAQLCRVIFIKSDVSHSSFLMRHKKFQRIIGLFILSDSLIIVFSLFFGFKRSNDVAHHSSFLNVIVNYRHIIIHKFLMFKLEETNFQVLIVVIVKRKNLL